MSNQFTSFLERKNIKVSLKRYGIDALSSMALGLFSSLIVGLILKEIGIRLGIPFLEETGLMAMSLMGACIGVAVAHSLEAPPLVLFSSVAVGYAGDKLGGGPAGAFVAVLIAAEIGKMVSKETKIDIIATPVVTLLIGFLCATVISPVISNMMNALGYIIMWATELMPLPMGVIVSVVMGIVLTLPISSAALSIMLGLSGLAGGAATAGCCAQMVGFAVASFKENGISGLLSQGIGTSMLQIPNIIKNPKIWIPAILTSAITGPIATVVLQMENSPEGAGMGTSGLVGQFCTFTTMGYSADIILKVVLLHFILPAVLTLIFSEFLYKIGWIKPGDMKL